MKQIRLNLIATLSILFFINNIQAQVSLNWAKHIGGTSTDQGRSIAIDAANNIYSTGYFNGTVDFDPGPAIVNLNSGSNGEAIFISKLDSAGNLLWARQIGGGYSNVGESITVDSVGYVYVMGEFHGTVDFDPGPGVHSLTESSTNNHFDIFILKLDSFGNYVNVIQIGSTSGYEYAKSIKIYNNQVYATGSFQNTVDFNPGTPVYNLTSVYQWNMFVLKLDLSLNFVWAKQVNNVMVTSMVLDTSGNIYLAGSFNNQTVDFDPGSSVYNLSGSPNGNQTAFVLKLNAAGAFVWAKQIEGDATIENICLAVDMSGNVHLTGAFYSGSSSAAGGWYGSIDVDPGPGVFSFTDFVTWNSFPYDLFITKLNTNGDFVWAKHIGGTGGIKVSSIEVNPFGNVYVAGNFGGGVTDFDPGIGSDSLTGTSSFEIYLLKLDANGNFVWAEQFGVCDPLAGGDPDIKIVLNNSCDIYLGGTIGSFAGSASGNADTHPFEPADYDPSSSVFNMTTNGYNDIYISKLKDGNCCSAAPQALITPLSSINFCSGDSVILNAGSGFLSYYWLPSGQTSQTITINSSANYSLVVTNGCGIDTSSVIPIIVNATPTSNAGVDTIICFGQGIPLTGTGATTYTWLPSTGLNTTIGATVLASPTATTTYTLTGSSGICSNTDSVTVVVNPLPSISLTNDLSITQGSSIMLSATSGGTYSWSPTTALSCSNCASPTATPFASTTYCVNVTDSNGCASSECVNITVDIQCGELFVPNVFSPNGDGKNDVLEVKINPNCVTDYNMLIFDRWGEKVFESNDINLSWDGTYKVKALDNATFVYYLKITLINTDAPVSKKGNVSIIK